MKGEAPKQLRALTQTLSFSVAEIGKKAPPESVKEDSQQAVSDKIGYDSPTKEINQSLTNKKPSAQKKERASKLAVAAADATLNAAKMKLKVLEAERKNKEHKVSAWCQKFLSSENSTVEEAKQEISSSLLPMQDFIIENFRDSQDGTTARSRQLNNRDDVADNEVATKERVATPAPARVSKRKRTERPRTESRYYNESEVVETADDVAQNTKTIVSSSKETGMNTLQPPHRVKQPKLSGPATIKAPLQAKKSTHKTLILHKPSTSIRRSTTQSLQEQQQSPEERRVQSPYQQHYEGHQKEKESVKQRRFSESRDSLIDIRLELAAAASALETYELHMDRAERALAIARKDLMQNNSAGLQARDRIADAVNELDSLSRM
mmetsp:Transcript_17090/g.25753  ORF Transcript_17090/g.25753 Transcript_17090/m.25753 type:complete len:379 (+) Transcript_17090:84-1220(+)